MTGNGVMPSAGFEKLADMFVDVATNFDEQSSGMEGCVELVSDSNFFFNALAQPAVYHAFQNLGASLLSNIVSKSSAAENVK